MRYWIGVASRNHVARGIAGGFCQLCHGKAQPLRRMSAGDWIIYYSPKEEMDGNVPCQRFTAIGEVQPGEVYAHAMTHWFVPHRRDVHFHDAREADIRPLITQLEFIQDKSRWGYAFRYGHLEISRADFERIATAMLGESPAVLEDAAASGARSITPAQFSLFPAACAT